MNKEEFRKKTEPLKKFFSDKRVQTGLVILALLAILILGTWIRVQNSSLLVDKTTGEYIPLALDPYYFLRVSETIIETGNNLPKYDSFRSPHFDVPWTDEILPYATVGIYKVMKIFNSEASLGFSDIINPVVFFVFGILIFFFLIYYLTKSKWIAVLSAFMLSILPPYLYRTMMGFSDHESIGMFAFFLALLFYAMSMRLEGKRNKAPNNILLGALLGFATTFTIVSWGGISKFLFMIIPMGFFVYWLIHAREKNSEKKIYLYISWILSFLIFNSLFGIGIVGSVRSYLLNSTGFLSLFVLGTIIIDYFAIKFSNKIKIKKFKEYRIFYSVLGMILVGAILYQIFVGNVFSFFGDILAKLISPFGNQRVSITVAENAQPYLSDWIGQIGKVGFWIFFLGTVLVGNNISKNFKKGRWLFLVSWVLFVSGILFTRISGSSALNGTSFLSKGLYFLSFLFFLGSALYVYIKEEKFEISTDLILIAAWMIPMLITARSAIRLFFAIVPFAAFMMIYAVFEVYKLFKENKEDLGKMLLFVILIVMVVSLLLVSNRYIQTDFATAKMTGPSANSIWQDAMGWVRNNTIQGSLFLHWWDYGYWVQTLGERPTVTDGGHSQGSWGDHLVGRYVLTTPFPETAKSFILTHGVDYLLIDQTDIGKYSAYSSIGTDGEKDDRTSWIQNLVSSSSDIQEGRNGTVRIYRGTVGLDEDVVYLEENRSLFLAKENSALIGALVEFDNNDFVASASGIYYNNGKQEQVPIRNLFYNGRFYDFGEGLNVTFYIYPRIELKSGIPSSDNSGALMYLSERTRNSLLAQIYLMDDVQNLYPEFELAYPTNGGIYYYQGVRGPIKIWKINLEDLEKERIITHEEFLASSGDYGGLDDFEFISN